MLSDKSLMRLAVSLLVLSGLLLAFATFARIMAVITR